MNKKPKNQSAVLQDSLIVQPIELGKKIYRCSSSQNGLIASHRSPKLVKTTKSVQKTPHAQVKYPLTNIPLGLEERKTTPNRLRTEEKSSTLEIINKLKEIELQTQKSDVLEQANDELSVAYKQLQEIQKLITRKANEQQKLDSDEAVEVQTKHRQQAIVNNCNRQLEKFQKKYLHKTRIRYKTVRDVENLTLAHIETQKREEIEKQEKQREIKILYSNPQKMQSIGSNATFFLGNEDNNKIQNYEPSLKKINMSLRKGEAVSTKVENIPSPSVDNFEDKIRSLLKGKVFQPAKVSEKAAESEINKIRYLLKPEHCSNARSETSNSEATQVDDDVREAKSASISVSHSNKHRKNGPKYNSHDANTDCVGLRNKPKLVRKVRFQDPRLENSVLHCNNFSSSEDMDESSDDTTTVSDKRTNSAFIKLPVEAENSQQRQNRRLSGSKMEQSTISLDGESAGNNTKKYYVDGKRKLNLLLYGRDKLGEDLDDDCLADSVLKSAYLSREFNTGFRKAGSSVNRDQAGDAKSMQLLQSVIHKFRDKLEPTQLAKLRRRDQKLYTTLNRSLRDTLYTEIKK